MNSFIEILKQCLEHDRSIKLETNYLNKFNLNSYLKVHKNYPERMNLHQSPNEIFRYNDT